MWVGRGRRLALSSKRARAGKRRGVSEQDRRGGWSTHHGLGQRLDGEAAKLEERQAHHVIRSVPARHQRAVVSSCGRVCETLLLYRQRQQQQRPYHPPRPPEPIDPGERPAARPAVSRELGEHGVDVRAGRIDHGLCPEFMCQPSLRDFKAARVRCLVAEEFRRGRPLPRLDQQLRQISGSIGGQNRAAHGGPLADCCEVCFCVFLVFHSCAYCYYSIIALAAHIAVCIWPFGPTGPTTFFLDVGGGTRRVPFGRPSLASRLVRF